jgi:hypothetical protein
VTTITIPDENLYHLLGTLRREYGRLIAMRAKSIRNGVNPHGSTGALVILAQLILAIDAGRWA